MSAEENKAIVRRFLEQTVARANLDVIDELLVPDFVDRSLMPGQGPTREDFKRTIAEIHEAFSTTSFTIEEQVAEGDTVVTKYRLSAVERGEIMGIPPSGKEETNEGIYIHRLHRGKITEEWSRVDARPVMGISRKRYASESVSSKSYTWPEASSKPRSPRRYPNWRAGRSLLTTSPLGR
jgi:predicted ester cyclase